MSKRMDIVVGTVILLSVVVGIGFKIYEVYSKKKLYINLLNLENKNRTVYVNDKKIVDGNKVVEGLKNIKVFRPKMKAVSGSLMKYIDIKIFSEDSGVYI